MKLDNHVSIVIPVYNEAAHLPACLDAISRQTVKPYEVIVVDNNSTDATAAIARSYPFVKVLRQKKQGVVYARDAGFDAARGEIIGRIDADTIISDNWVETLLDIFADEHIGAATGRALYYDLPLAPLANKIDLTIRRYLAYVLQDEVAMQGANMALRRSVWQKVRGEVCRSGGMHEDFDLTVHTNRLGFTIIFDESLMASLGYRQAESTFAEFASYVFLSPKTYALHGLTSCRYMYPVVWLALIGYVPLKLLHRGYDAATQEFSWQAAFGPATRPRVNPATYVD